jgi:hypothetical protein
MDIIGDENKSSLVRSGDVIPTPNEIRKVLDDGDGPAKEDKAGRSSSS